MASKHDGLGLGGILGIHVGIHVGYTLASADSKRGFLSIRAEQVIAPNQVVDDGSIMS